MQAIGGTSDDIPMWIADMDYTIAPEIIAAIQKRLEHPIIGYSFQPPEYRHAINCWYTRRYGTNLRDDMIVPCQSVLGSMQLLVCQCIKPGDRIMMFTPIYPQFYEIIKTAGAQLLEYTLCGCEDIDWTMAEGMIAQSKAVIFCNPHNPLARAWTEEELRRIAELCGRYSVKLFSDEVHGDMTMFEHRYYSLASFEEAQDQVIVFTSAAKTFNIAGLGGAALLIPDENLRKQTVQLLERYFQTEINALTAEGIQAAYTYGDQWVDEAKKYMEENVRMVLTYIEKYMPKLKCQHQATFLMWIDCRGLNRSDLNMAEIIKQNAHILVDDGARYGALGAGFIRMNIACSRELLTQAMERLHDLYSDIEKGNF